MSHCANTSAFARLWGVCESSTSSAVNWQQVSDE